MPTPGFHICGFTNFFHAGFVKAFTIFDRQ
jgi:hypothetical protein